MRPATLGNIQLHRAHLAPDFPLDGVFQRSAGAGKLLMTKRVGRRHTKALAHIGAVRKAHALGDGNHHIRVLL